MDLSNLNDARGVVSTGRKQDQILQEVRKLHQAPDPRRQCPFCGGTLAGGFVKCKNCGSDITWVEGWPRKPGNTRSWLGGWKKHQRGKGGQTLQRPSRPGSASETDPSLQGPRNRHRPTWRRGGRTCLTRPVGHCFRGRGKPPADRAGGADASPKTQHARVPWR